MSKCISILIVVCLVFLFGCAQSRPEYSSQESDVERYASLLSDLSKVKIGSPKEFLAGHALMGRNLIVTFEGLPKSPKGRAVLVPDAVYWCPPKTWVENVFLPYCHQTLISRKAKYNKSYDCDDFSRDFLSISHACFVDQGVRLPIDSISVAEIWYTPAYALFLKSLGFPYEDHAINFIIVHEDSEVLFIEPQTCKIVNLTAEEIQSIYYVRF